MSGATGWWRRWRGQEGHPPSPPPVPVSPAAGRASSGGFDTVYDIFPDIESQRQRGSFPDIVEDAFWEVVERVRPYTMLTIEALYELHQGVRYVAANAIEGDLVECGVFMGGSVLAAAEWARHYGMSDRRFFLYDTFCGFPDGTPPETDAYGNVVRMYSHPNYLAVARDALARSGWAPERFVFVEGDVTRTLQETRPERIALLRLDTDTYASTRVELETLYPALRPGGVLILDDYGQFLGARQATDEFLAAGGLAPLLHRVSPGVRSGIKPYPRPEP
jgi:hypothetical protein